MRRSTILPSEIRAANAERDAALLSLDRAQIQAYAKRVGAELPEDEDVFWIGVHKARELLMTLPPEAREESRRWLAEHGSEPFEGGPAYE